MTGAVAFPIGMFWLAWSGAYASVHWIVPCIGGVILAFAICILFVSALSYLSESYLEFAASAQAGNTIVRSGVAAAAPLYTQQMFDKLTVGGGGSLIAGVAVLLMPIPFVFYRYGGKIRARSSYAPTPEADHGEETSDASDALASPTPNEGKQEECEEIEKTTSEIDSVRTETVDTRFDEIEVIEKRETGN